MAYVISDDCIACGSCEGECPVGAISMGAEHYEIDANACTECGTCAAQCPVEAIKQAIPWPGRWQAPRRVVEAIKQA